MLTNEEKIMLCSIRNSIPSEDLAAARAAIARMTARLNKDGQDGLIKAVCELSLLIEGCSSLEEVKAAIKPIVVAALERAEESLVEGDRQ